MSINLDTCSEDEYIEKTINDLTGTCKSLDISHYLQRGFNEDKLLQTLDSEIFLCSCCSWWCDLGESNDQDGENVCNDCYEED